MKTRLSTRLLAGVATTVLGLAALGGSAQAALAPPPVRATVDANGVDLLTGGMTLSTQDVAIGNPASGGLVFGRNRNVGDLAAWRNNLTGTLNSDSGVYTVSFGGVSESFTLAGGVYTSNQGAGSTLTFNSGTNRYAYTSAAGVVAVFDKAKATTGYGYYLQDANEGLLTQVTYPNGQVDTYTYVTATVGSTSGIRLQSVTNNLGYHLKLQYANATASSTGDFPNWLKLSKVTGVNGAVDYCDPTANSCSGSWPSATYGVPGDNAQAQTVTDTMGRVTRYTYDSNGYLTGIRRPSAGSDTTTVTYDGNNRVASVSNGAGTWTYSYSIASDTLTTTVTDPLSHSRVVTSYISPGVVTSQTDGAGHTTSYSYDDDYRLLAVTYPEGNSVSYSYDSRGNVTGTTYTPKPGSGLSAITTSASYDSSCGNAVKCNKPNSTTDALGKVTDYTYDSTTGALTSVTLPAPTTGAVRPQTRYGYTGLYAYYKNSGGSIVAASSPVSMLTGISECATGSTASPTCVGTSDEVKTTLVYGATGVANNLLPTSVSKGAGDGSLTATTAFTYDSVGNQLTVDGPLSGTADTTRYRYDDDRELVGVVGPDPDGAGSLKNRATRYTYNSDGQVTLVEQGKANSQSDGDWAGFTVLQQQTRAYDGLGRKVKTTQASGGGTTYAVTQYSYDNANRLDCVAVRMNPAIFGSLPGSACTLGTTGANGDDRITKYAYDGADRVTKITDGYGTASQRDEATYAYTSNGKQATLADALGGLTTFEYDGFDRLLKIRYPDKTTRTSSSTTDYEGFTYDAASRVTADRRRDGQTFGNSWDSLGRLTLLDAPSGQNDVTYAYDNLGRQTSASYSGHSVASAYDALGRVTSVTAPLGAVGYQYDLAGQRTRMTWPDSFYVTYDYDPTGEMTVIRENGATSGAGVLATYAYDDLGRRVSLTRGNGDVIGYSYDGVSRLTGLSQDLSGTTYDQTYTLTYDAGSNILSRVGSNSSYAPATPYTGARNSTANGLNQITASGSASLTYDDRGNLTGDGTSTYAYDGLNRLTGMNSGAVSLTYDPLGRLFQTAGVGTTRFAYDGGQIIGEYNSSGTLQRRYVQGATPDEPLVWYEGTGASDRRWMAGDPLGSVVSIVSGSGTAIDSYDEYGVPGSGNTGRFQYTGQAWIPEIGLAHYKARVYAPGLGRFLQADPAGYDVGTNLYAYVDANPTNRVDPTGLYGEGWGGDFDWGGDYDWGEELNSSGGTQSADCQYIWDQMLAPSSGDPLYDALAREQWRKVYEKVCLTKKKTTPKKKPPVSRPRPTPKPNAYQLDLILSVDPFGGRNGWSRITGLNLGALPGASSTAWAPSQDVGSLGGN